MLYKHHSIGEEKNYVNCFQGGHRELFHIKQPHINLVTALLLCQDHWLAVSLSHLRQRCHNLQFNVESHGAGGLVKKFSVLWWRSVLCGWQIMRRGKKKESRGRLESKTLRYLIYSTR